jgi:DNA repair ATPase RecN
MEVVNEAYDKIEKEMENAKTTQELIEIEEKLKRLLDLVRKFQRLKDENLPPEQPIQFAEKKPVKGSKPKKSSCK